MAYVRWVNSLDCPRCGVGTASVDPPAEDTAPGTEWWCDHCDRVWTILLAGEHQPARPSWRCVADGGNWPCRRARADLIAGFATDLAGLERYLSALREEAVRDLGGPAWNQVTAAEVSARFRIHQPGPDPEPSGTGVT